MKKITMKPSQVRQLINEVAKRERKIYELQLRKEEVLLNLEEMYINSGIESEGAIGDFFNKAKDSFMGSREEWKAKLEKYFLDKQAWFGGNFEIPQGQDLEDAVTAAQKHGTVKIFKSPVDGKWHPVTSSRLPTGG